MLAEMLHCSFSPVEDKKVFFFFQKFCEVVAQLFSTADGAEVGHRDKMASIMLSREMSSGMCKSGVLFSPRKVCQCNAQSGSKKKKSTKEKRVSQTVVKSVVGVPRGCFGNNVRSRPCDFF